MSSRKSIIVISSLIASVWIAAIAYAKVEKKKASLKKNSTESNYYVIDPDSCGHVVCCIESVEECDTTPPLHRLYISDCGIPFYSYRNYNVGDSVDFYNSVKH
jgi:hypothetical protein